jgi:hypothetical protein
MAYNSPIMSLKSYLADGRVLRVGYAVKLPGPAVIWRLLGLLAVFLEWVGNGAEVTYPFY